MNWGQKGRSYLIKKYGNHRPLQQPGSTVDLIRPDVMQTERPIFGDPFSQAYFRELKNHKYKIRVAENTSEPTSARHYIESIKFHAERWDLLDHYEQTSCVQDPALHSNGLQVGPEGTLALPGDLQFSGEQFIGQQQFMEQPQFVAQS